MKIKLDENLPEALVVRLTELGHETDNVRQAAQKAGRFFITQDLDFSDIRQFAPGTHHGLMLVRLREPGRLALTARISEAFALNESESWAGGFLLLTDHKLRIHRSKSNP